MCGTLCASTCRAYTLSSFGWSFVSIGAWRFRFNWRSKFNSQEFCSKDSFGLSIIFRTSELATAILIDLISQEFNENKARFHQDVIQSIHEEAGGNAASRKTCSRDGRKNRSKGSRECQGVGVQVGRKKIKTSRLILKTSVSNRRMIPLQVEPTHPTQRLLDLIRDALRYSNHNLQSLTCNVVMT
ncbi:uncharacterized protein LOC108212904 [Daucus carota subsp. sativus]|uniref:uncharacterized protein LOC108212904 n=1 Tax=Daucus carota subsp. sativus TaxID=79200 RepID=UPI003083EA4F